MKKTKNVKSFKSQIRELKSEIRKAAGANSALRQQINALQDRLAVEIGHGNSYRLRVGELKKIVTSMEPLLVGEYTEDELYELPLPVLRKVVEDQLYLKKLLEDNAAFRN